MHQTQWSPERPLPPPVSLTSQSHHEKPPEVTCTSRGMAASYCRWKNVHLGVEAFNRLISENINAQLVIYGLAKQPLEPDYQNEIIALSKSNPFISLREYDPGWLSQMRASDIFLHPAEQEPFGIVILEAYAAGCRLIVPTGTFLDDLLSGLTQHGVLR